MTRSHDGYKVKIISFYSRIWLDLKYLRNVAFYDYFWHIAFGGCSLSRPTQRWLLGPEFMGFKEGEGWEKVELEKVKGESRWSVIPMVWGRLVKRA